MLRDGEAALDVVQEFALALSRRASFRAEGTLEAWLWHRPQPCATGSARGSTQMRMTLVPTATDRRSYAATVVICETEVPLEIGVNPIWYDDRDTGQRRINGSTLLVAEQRHAPLVCVGGAANGPDTGRNWSAAHWDSRVCSAEAD